MDIRIALAGNPNSGKTTLFNALTGLNQYVGNWPGVTVEKKEGRLKNHNDVKVVDLPGSYSLSPYTLEEVVSRDYLISERPDIILNIVDASNLERNLYLTTQLTELGLPVVIALNMMDVVKKNGDQIDSKALSKKLGVPVCEISALKEEGIKEAVDIVLKSAKENKVVIPTHSYSNEIEEVLNDIVEIALANVPKEVQRWYSIKLFERDSKITEKLNIDSRLLNQIENDICKVEKKLDDDSESLITNERYLFINNVIDGSYKKKRKGETTSDKIDKIVTNRFLALPIFAVVMFFVYYISVSTVGTWMTDWINDCLFGDELSLFGIALPGIPIAVTSLLESINCATWLVGLIVDGIIGGVGAVLGFLPQMLVLFLFLAFLEGCGYMARVAFIMDRIFRKFGLSGKSFIPMLIGTGCSVPAIMASRTIENIRDRRMTIMTTTFIPCGAKLPIIALIAGALFGGAWWVAPSSYFVGIFAIVVSGIILKKTNLFSGDPAPFVMELPQYHIPTLSVILRSMWERGSSFIRKAGTVILLSAIVLWFLQAFGFENGQFTLVEDLNNSILAFVGNLISWIFIPLGWGSWEATVATITGLIAKENVVSTFGILFGFSEVAEDGLEIWGTMAQTFTSLSGFSFLVFNLLCAPCFAAIGAIKREMNDRKWLLIAISYQCIFAYIVSFMIYQIGSLIIGTGNIIGGILGILCFAMMIYLIIRKPKSIN